MNLPQIFKQAVGNFTNWLGFTSENENNLNNPGL